jgi:hypothetical protein
MSHPTPESFEDWHSADYNALGHMKLEISLLIRMVGEKLGLLWGKRNPKRLKDISSAVF